MARLGLMARALALSFTNVLTISVATINMFLFRLIDFVHRFRLIEKYDSCKIFSQGKLVKNICTLQTTQLLEAVSDLPDGELPTGLVVANDSDNARCYMLTHQVTTSASAGWC